MSTTKRTELIQLGKSFLGSDAKESECLALAICQRWHELSNDHDLFSKLSAEEWIAVGKYADQDSDLAQEAADKMTQSFHCTSFHIWKMIYDESPIGPFKKAAHRVMWQFQ